MSKPTHVTHRRLPARLSSALVVLSCAVPSLALAQTNERLYEELDFRFVTPGARAMAMGKAFVGLADDATAAYSNPAGLSSLLDQEVSFEFTVTNIKHYRLISGETMETQAFGDAVVTPSFFSYVLPLNRFTVSLFTNRIQDYQETFLIERRESDAIPGFDETAFGTLSIEVDNYGLGLSAIVNRYVSIGGSLVLATLDLASRFRNGQPLNARNGTDTIDSGSEIGVIAGVLIKPFRRFSLGAVYHSGQTFDLETTLFGDFLENGMDVTRTGDRRNIQYAIPDKFTVGISWRPLEQLVTVFDVAWIDYSKLVADSFLVVDFMDSAAELTRDNFFIESAWEAHLGTEYRLFFRRATVGLRAGVFTDPDHQLRFVPNDNGHVANSILDFRFNTASQKTDVGVTFGAGVALFNRVQIDAAGSFIRDANQAVISMVIRVG